MVSYNEKNYALSTNWPILRYNLTFTSTFCGDLCSSAAIVFTYPCCMTNPIITGSSLFSLVLCGITCKRITALFPFRHTTSLKRKVV